MKNKKEYKDLEVNFIGGEELTAKEENDLHQYFAKRKKQVTDEKKVV